VASVCPAVTCCPTATLTAETCPVVGKDRVASLTDPMVPVVSSVAVTEAGPAVASR
jgi:hypothetical protein